MANRKRAVRGLANVSTERLTEELQRRRRSLGPLTRALDAARTRLADLEGQVAALGGNGAAQAASGGRRSRRSGRRRARNKAGLVEALAGALRGKTMGVGEAAEAALRSGYKTTAKNFRVIVNAALIKRRDLFRKVRRGKYTAK